MQIGTSGGGFFYKGFDQFECVGPITVTPNPVAGYGAWGHMIPPTLTGRARWFNLILNQTGGSQICDYQIQIALGPVGAEVQIIPNGPAGLGYLPLSFIAAGVQEFSRTLSFPFAIRAGEISLRAAGSVLGSHALEATIYLQN